MILLRARAHLDVSTHVYLPRSSQLIFRSSRALSSPTIHHRCAFVFTLSIKSTDLRCSIAAYFRPFRCLNSDYLSLRPFVCSGRGGYVRNTRVRNTIKTKSNISLSVCANSESAAEAPGGDLYHTRTAAARQLPTTTSAAAHNYRETGKAGGRKQRARA